MKLADNISRNLINFARGGGREILLPNFYHGNYEMDLFRLMPSGLVVEYEIKISKSDFKVDFKKDSGKKHRQILMGDGPNRFFFVVPENLVTIHEVPDYAGLIYFSSGKDLYSERMYTSFHIEKNAPLLNKRKVNEKRPDFYRQLAETLAFRELHLRHKLHYLKSKQ